jgi:group II intron reverse transcriptase/maturase
MTVEPGEPTRGTPGRKGERRGTEPFEGKAAGTPIPIPVSTKLARIAELAREAPERAFLSLAHHIDHGVLREAFRRTRKDGATGVDGRTGKEYEEDLEANLQSLLDRFKSGRYKAPPVRRTYVPKGDGSKTRPIGIPTIEDKVLQRAVTMVLEAVYEQDFLPVSHGYRPGRSAHTALAALHDGLKAMGGGWVLEVDVSSFFDSLDHARLRELLDQRVRDGVLRRTIDKWLAAGVMEGAEWSRPDAGTPQGGVVSPLLANIYLHETVDRWFERDVKPRLMGRAFLVRYADDLVMVFSNEHDARRVLAALPRRFGKFGLRLHPDKTRLLCFRPVPGGRRPPHQGGRSFDFLGFTHFWCRNLRGFWVVTRKTSRSRQSRAVRRISEWLRANRHRPVAWQHRQLVLKLRGHDNYFGLVGNKKRLFQLRYEVTRSWRKRLERRSNHRLPWDRFKRILERHPLPAPTLHPRDWGRVANPCT